MSGSLPLIVGVTGTNGKTSVTTMLASLLNKLGIPAAAIGQRVETPEGVRDRCEVPSGVKGLPTYIAWLTQKYNLKVIAIEVYSAALAKGLHRLVRYDAVAFTNITEDHMNVHGNFDAYVKAKLRIFSHLAPNGIIVFDSSEEGLLPVQSQCHDLGLEYVIPEEHATPFDLSYQQQNCRLALSLAEQLLHANSELASNKVISQAHLLEKAMELRSPPGRYEKWRMPNGVIAVVDFAHNPGGITAVINSTRTAFKNNEKVGFLLSSKGGWGEQKRRSMAKAASSADLVIVSDDDPRKEDPAIIRLQLSHAHGYEECSPRSHAIHTLCAAMKKGDVAIIAGRGADQHWQSIVGRYPYSDVHVLQQLGGVKIA
ncbi:Mur ligase family protein [Glaciecola siphonariae]|uniref:Mur ligase family protein n=1 Tax=Glaciecola siphonariae TaxID=521012 RepID=A0ABV9LVS7_9ALTE